WRGDQGHDTVVRTDHCFDRGRRSRIRRRRSRVVLVPRHSSCFGPLTHTLAYHAAAECVTLPPGSGAPSTPLLTTAHTLSPSHKWLPRAGRPELGCGSFTPPVIVAATVLVM